jgi:hypothetical protein
MTLQKSAILAATSRCASKLGKQRINDFRIARIAIRLSPIEIIRAHRPGRSRRAIDRRQMDPGGRSPEDSPGGRGACCSAMDAPVILDKLSRKSVGRCHDQTAAWRVILLPFPSNGGQLARPLEGPHPQSSENSARSWRPLALRLVLKPQGLDRSSVMYARRPVDFFNAGKPARDTSHRSAAENDIRHRRQLLSKFTA